MRGGKGELQLYRAKLLTESEHANESDQFTSGTVKIKYWAQSERLARALKYSGMCVLFAVGAVFLPIIHFVLVPLFLLAAPAVGYLFYGQESFVMGGEGKCPACGDAFLVAKCANNFPLRDLCTSCHQTVRVRLGERIEI